MTGEFFVDWATMAVSLFNTVLLLWLGLTILLNAELRTWGTWLAGSATTASTCCMCTIAPTRGSRKNTPSYAT